MKELMTHPNLKKMAEKVAKFTRLIIDEVNRMPDDKKRKQLQVKVLNEHQILKEAENFFEQELNAKIHVYSEEDPQRHDPKKKSELARPYRPAIYIEWEKLYLGYSKTILGLEMGPWPSLDKASAF